MNAFLVNLSLPDTLRYCRQKPCSDIAAFADFAEYAHSCGSSWCPNGRNTISVHVTEGQVAV